MAILNKQIETILKKECFYCGPVFIDMTDAQVLARGETGERDEWDYPTK